MIKLDEDALVCDLAEIYNIYDYRQLPALKVAVFACGLRENSRIKMKLSNQKITTEVMLLSSLSDILNLIWWSKTKDGQDNKNRPKSILQSIFGKVEVKDIQGFASSEDFELKRNEILINIEKKGGNDGN